MKTRTTKTRIMKVEKRGNNQNGEWKAKIIESGKK